MKIKLKMSAAIPRIYRIQFGEDIIVGMNKMFNRTLTEGGDGTPVKMTPEELTMLENLCYACHKHADPKQPDDIDEWIGQFDIKEVQDKCLEVIDLWAENIMGTSTSKKNKD